MPWWGWVTVGALLLVAEAVVVDLEFYLVFLGISALLTGLIVLSGGALPIWGQWLLFAGLSGTCFLFFRRALYDRLRPPADAEIGEGVLGERAVACEEIRPGERGAVTLRGTTWTAHNTGSTPIGSGRPCVVEGTRGLIVEVSAAD